MITFEELQIITKYGDKIRDLCFCHTEMTQSDFQGVSEAIVLQIIQDIKQLQKGN